MPLSKPLIAELEALESANLDPDRHVAAASALACLHFLRQISQMLNKPIETITAADVIAQFTQPPVSH